MLPIETIEAGRRDGFDLRFEFYPEDMHPADSFDDTVCDLKEIMYKIETGQWEWFVVKCVASINGVDLGDDWLGGCLYDSYEQFVDENGYSEDMIDQALEEARQNTSAIVQKALAG